MAVYTEGLNTILLRKELVDEKDLEKFIKSKSIFLKNKEYRFIGDNKIDVDKLDIEKDDIIYVAFADIDKAVDIINIINSLGLNNTDFNFEKVSKFDFEFNNKKENSHIILLFIRLDEEFENSCVKYRTVSLAKIKEAIIDYNSEYAEKYLSKIIDDSQSVLFNKSNEIDYDNTKSRFSCIKKKNFCRKKYVKDDCIYSVIDVWKDRLFICKLKPEYSFGSHLSVPYNFDDHLLYLRAVNTYEAKRLYLDMANYYFGIDKINIDNIDAHEIITNRFISRTNFEVELEEETRRL